MEASNIDTIEEERDDWNLELLIKKALPELSQEVKDALDKLQDIKSDLSFNVTQDPNKRQSGLKLLQAAMIVSPSAEGREWLATKVLTVDAPRGKGPTMWQLNELGVKRELENMGKDLFWNLLFPLKAQGGRKSDEYKKFVADAVLLDQEHIERLEGVTGRVDSRGNFSKDLLARDGYKCCITGRWDNDYLRSPEGRDKDKGARSTCGMSATEGAHIIPFSLNGYKETDVEKAEATRRTWGLLEKWGGLDPTTLQGGLINNLKNGMTLSTTCHDEFGKCRLYLQSTDVVNSYRVVGLDDVVDGRYENLVMFKSQEESGSPPPLKELLAIHAAIAQVSKLSGAGEVIDKILQDMETVDETPAEDGTSRETLTPGSNPDPLRKFPFNNSIPVS